METKFWKRKILERNFGRKKNCRTKFLDRIKQKKIKMLLETVSERERERSTRKME